MRLLRGSQSTSEICSPTVATIGNFDGVHKGHQALLAALRVQANNLGLPLLVVLFEPQPSEYFRGKDAPARLSSLREKLHTLKACGVDFVFCLKFDRKLASMSAADFAKHYLFSLLKIKYLSIGADFRFGQGRIGDLKLLTMLARESGCKIEVFPNYDLDNERVSSTKIRQALCGGDLAKAAHFLGRAYSMCWRVVPGRGLGRQWGIPTANLKLCRQNLALSGVYGVNVKRKCGGLFAGVANIGCRPTVDGIKNILEIHIFDFNESLYGEILEVTFLYKLREEKKFSCVDDLIDQIHKDISTAKAYTSGLTKKAQADTKSIFNEDCSLDGA